MTAAVLLVVSVGILSRTSTGQDDAPDAPKQASVSPELQKKYDAFEKMVSGVKLIGSFTVTGSNTDELQKEEYSIKSVTKLPEGDLWMFRARVKYGDNDYTVPLPL
ncbi:MAG: hypothetical protein VX739_13730, partial [Planctomycetota bacterium]|nr:hypothetical protein [Planctomycetota bacterium]